MRLSQAEPKRDYWRNLVPPDQTIGWVREGDIFYYRDNTESLKAISKEEEAKLVKAAQKVKACISIRLPALPSQTNKNSSSSPLGAPLLLGAILAGNMHIIVSIN